MIVQPKLEVPAKIAEGITSGKFILIGGVVRNALSGRIVTLLKEAPNAENNQEVLGSASAVLKARGVVVATVLGTLTVGATALVVLKKRKQAGKSEVAECVASLNASLCRYLDAGRKGSLDPSIISRLISDLDAVIAYSNDTSVAVNFPADLWELLFHLVIDHTQKLFGAYSNELDELPWKAAASGNVIVVLRRHLDVQRQILVKAA
ncbi:hypothetical protein [Herbidospora daliensis]|uniref:hypothetical protein n=1 Tax=Herbidospora daliensis TaxID=295585 RepID=UPI0012FAA040|nr:hypothetical protein [Herbidospora daliensis]